MEEKGERALREVEGKEMMERQYNDEGGKETKRI